MAFLCLDKQWDKKWEIKEIEKEPVLLEGLGLICFSLWSRIIGSANR